MENIIMALGNLSTGLIALIIGIILLSSKGKASNIIAGFNSMSDNEKNRYNRKKLTNYAGVFTLILGIVTLFGGIIYLFAPNIIILIVSWAIFVVILIAWVILANVKPPFLNQ